MRILIADDSALLRTGLRLLLEDAGHTIVAEVATASEIPAAVAEHQPDLSILDVRMPPGYIDDGLRAAIEVRAAQPTAPILVLSQYVEQAAAAKLFRRGTRGLGYLLKDRVADIGTFLDALEQVRGGASVLDPEVVAQLLVQGQADDRLSLLTARERDVMALLAEGMSNAGIAEQLVVTEGAVEKHVRSIFEKLDLQPSTDWNRRVQAAIAWLTDPGRLRP
ncbi:MAG: response regulator transcription factor [Chloroflexi bacterium]|nr:response regulator transcription factor [Chloroflexota bacterium]PWB43408.1 MAG: DNA-binding response regulator [Dehalococcoidia bacterium]